MYNLRNQILLGVLTLCCASTSASSLFSWIIFHLVYNLKIVGSAILVVCTLALAIFNRRRIIKESRQK